MKPRSAQSASFRQVFLRSLTLLRLKRYPVLVGALSFALLAAVTAATVQVAVQRIQSRIGAESGLSWQELQDAVDQRLSAFSEADGMTVVKNFGKQSDPETLTSPDAAAMGFIAEMGPWLLASFFIDSVILALACLFFLLLATGGLQTGYESLQRLPGAMLPMLGLFFWFLFRSLIWLPFIGLFIAAYLAPRFILSPVILSSGEAGVFQSLQESMRRTSGRWLTIVLNLLALAVLAIAVLWIGLIMIAVVSLFSLKLALFAWLFLTMLVAAFVMFFLTMLTALLS